MYTLAIMAFMGLALFKLVDLIEDLLPGLTRFHTLITIAIWLGIGLAITEFAASYLEKSRTSGHLAVNTFEDPHIDVRGLHAAGVRTP